MRQAVRWFGASAIFFHLTRAKCLHKFFSMASVSDLFLRNEVQFSQEIPNTNYRGFLHVFFQPLPSPPKQSTELKRLCLTRRAPLGGPVHTTAPRATWCTKCVCCRRTPGRRRRMMHRWYRARKLGAVLDVCVFSVLYHFVWSHFV